MSSDTAFLAMYFEAPLLSFGTESKFDNRDTLNFPTRGVITGVIAAALGIERSNQAALAELAKLAMLSISCQAPQERLLNDFHTIGGGYAQKEKNYRVRQADDKIRKDAVLTNRQYWADGKYAAVVSGPRNDVERIAAALKDPVWGGWIGRKCCIPSVPIEQGVFDSEEEAIQRISELVQAQNKQGVELRIYEECDLSTGGSQHYFDVPEDYALRKFALRALVER